MSETTAPANPGSPEARALGCTCAVLDNGHGRGYMGHPDIFVISGDCPVHAKPPFGLRYPAPEADDPTTSTD